MSRIMYIGFSGTIEAGHKIGDIIVLSHTLRIFIENDPCDHYILSLNPAHPLNFVFDQAILEYNIEVVWDAWPIGDNEHAYRMLESRRRDRMVNGKKFDVYKELYLRIHGGLRQHSLCGSERGLGHRNIFEYYFYGQESHPKHCIGSTAFGRHSLGLQWRPQGEKRSVFVAPIAFSQSNDVFTMDYWKKAIDMLLLEKVHVTVNTPNEGQFGAHPLLTYSYHPGNLRGLFEQVSHARLTLSGNTGIGWIAGAHGVPMIAGEPDFFWFMDYRYREAGVQSVIDIFGKGTTDAAGRCHNSPPPNPHEPVRMVLDYLETR